MIAEYSLGLMFDCRVSEEDSLFDGYCQVTDSLSAVFCQCEYGSISVCGLDRDVFQCLKTDTQQQIEVRFFSFIFKFCLIIVLLSD
jgi:hypothetical protein